MKQEDLIELKKIYWYNLNPVRLIDRVHVEPVYEWHHYNVGECFTILQIYAFNKSIIPA